MRKDLTDGLDERQKEAVLSPAHDLLVVAGPGSGKTRVLAARFARLLKDGEGVDKLLAVTFTNRAAGEMRERVSAMTGLDPATLDVGTFHSFCLQFLKKTRPGFNLYGRPDQVSLLEGLGGKNAEKAADAISAHKNLSYAPAVDPAGSGAARTAAPDGFDLYQEALKAKG